MKFQELYRTYGSMMDAAVELVCSQGGEDGTSREYMCALIDLIQGSIKSCAKSCGMTEKHLADELFLSKVGRKYSVEPTIEDIVLTADHQEQRDWIAEAIEYRAAELIEEASIQRIPLVDGLEIIGTDIDIDECERTGYMTMQYDPALDVKLDDETMCLFIQTYPEHLVGEIIDFDKTQFIFENWLSCDDVWEAYLENNPKSVDDMCGQESPRPKPSNVYELLNLVSDLVSHGGYL